MNESVKLVSVDAANVNTSGFFCYKSKPKSEGYHNKQEWLRQRFTEGMAIKILYENGRSVGFVETIPAEYAWRAVEAPGYLVIHCLWVVGRAKNKGYGSALLNACIEDARLMGKHGVVMVSSRGNWLANERLFLKLGFEKVDSAPPAFDLLVKRNGAGPTPVFPQDWEQRRSAYGPGMTVVYADQCPYMPDAIRHAREQFEARGIETRVVKLETSAAVRAQAPSAYGVFGIVLDGNFFCYTYLGKKELRLLDELVGNA